MAGRGERTGSPIGPPGSAVLIGIGGRAAGALGLQLASWPREASDEATGSRRSGRRGAGLADGRATRAIGPTPNAGRPVGLADGSRFWSLACIHPSERARRMWAAARRTAQDYIAPQRNDHPIAPDPAPCDNRRR